MPFPRAKSRSYKELTLQQLRSFGETARLGSLAAAAKSLGLTHPTVREQVMSLEREFHVKLIEPHGRGCHLTAEGRLLAEMVSPIVTSAAALRKRFELAREQADVRLVVAGPPRIIQEDLPHAVQTFLKLRPQVRLAFLEIRDDQVARAVEANDADLGLTTDRAPERVPPGLEFESAYEIDTLLLTPKRHPLARKKNVRPADLKSYPLITSRYTMSDQPELVAMLDRSGVLEGPAPRVEPFLAATVRRYVEMNFGIALVYGLPPRGKVGPLHERSMSKHFGRGLVRFVLRRGTAHEQLARELAQAIRVSNR